MDYVLTNLSLDKLHNVANITYIKHYIMKYNIHYIYETRMAMASLVDMIL